MHKNDYKFSFFQSTLSPSSSSSYRLNSTSGNTCILIQTDALLSIQYRDKEFHEDKEADIYLPDYPEIKGWESWRQFLVKTLLTFLLFSGVCDDSDESQLTLTFKGFVLLMSFERTPGKILPSTSH